MFTFESDIWELVKNDEISMLELIRILKFSEKKWELVNIFIKFEIKSGKGSKYAILNTK